MGLLSLTGLTCQPIVRLLHPSLVVVGFIPNFEDVLDLCSISTPSAPMAIESFYLINNDAANVNPAMNQALISMVLAMTQSHK